MFSYPKTVCLLQPFDFTRKKNEKCEVLLSKENAEEYKYHSVVKLELMAPRPLSPI